MKHVIAFVPARGGSSRVQKKNLRLIGGMPLFLRACYNLNQILEKERIVVDSDDEEILKIAKDNGFQTLKRPSKLATNATDGNAFFRWETSNYTDADLYIQHLPPMPFCSKETLQKCFAEIEKGYDSIVCIGSEHYYLWDLEKKVPFYDLKHIPNSYNLKETVFETMGLYMITANAHRKTGLRIGENYQFISLPKIEQVDINYPEDYELAVAIEKGLERNSVYKIENKKNL